MSKSALDVRAELAADLARAVKGEVGFDPHSRVLHSNDASIYQIEALIAASGISCRQHIASATGRTPRHPVQVLANALAH